jgi:hypothetical protein
MELLQDVNWSLVAPLIVLQVILMIAALVSCIKQEETNGPKWMWVLIILFVNLLGPILYFVMGRTNS